MSDSLGSKESASTVNGDHPSPPIPDHVLLRLIGRGSYGEVWLARSLMGAYRAVKIIYRHTFENDRPFEREFAGIQRYEPISRSHDGFVQVLHVGRNESANCFFYVMELADDVATGSVIRPASYRPRTISSEIKALGRLPFEQLIPLSLSLTSAVGHLHRQGLVHRDLKPSNIIFVAGRPKIADLGLVSELGESRSFVGTTGFIPPEGPGSPQADLYSLGKLLYEASTGRDRELFPAIPDEWLELSHEANELEFHELLLKSCEGRVEKRYQKAEELLADLALLQSGKSVRRLRSLERRLAIVTKVGAAAIGLAVMVFGLYLFAAHRANLDRENLRQVQRAERKAQQELWNSLLAQARLGRQSRLSGCRLETLTAIRTAAALSNHVELRNEAIATLALADLRPVPTSPTEPSPLRNLLFGGDLKYTLATDQEGGIHFRRVEDGRDDFILPNQGLPISSLYPATPRNRYLAVRYDNQQLVIWDLLSRRVALRVDHVQPRFSLEFSADSRLLAIVLNRQIALYEMATGQPLKQIALGARQPTGIWFSPDASTVALTFAEVNDVVLINLATGLETQRLHHPAQVQDLAWRTNGDTLATACWDFQIWLWNPTTGEPRQTLAGHEALPTQVAFHPNGQILASTSWDGTTRLWDVATGGILTTLMENGSDLRFNDTGQRLGMLTGNDYHVLLIESAGDRVCQFLQEPPSRNPSYVSPCQIEFSPDEHLLAAAGQDGVRLWDWERGTEEALLPTAHSCFATFAPSGRELITGDDYGVHRWQLTPGTNQTPDVWGPPHRISELGGTYRGALSRDGQLFAYAHQDQVLVQHGQTTPYSIPFAAAHFLAMSSDSHWLAISSRGPSPTDRVVLWDLDRQQAVWTNRQPGGATLIFSPDSHRLVTGSETEFCSWDLETRQPVRRIPRRNVAGLAGPTAFSHDGKVLAVALSRRQVQLLDAKTGAELGLLDSPFPHIISWIAFSPSDTQLAVATEAHAIQLWDLRRLRQQLVELNLDWEQPPYAPSKSSAVLQVRPPTIVRMVRK